MLLFEVAHWIKKITIGIKIYLTIRVPIGNNPVFMKIAKPVYFYKCIRQ